MDGVSQRISAGQDLDRATTQSSDVIDRCLNHLVVEPHQVGVLRTDGDGQPFVPLGLVVFVAVRGTRIPHRGALAGSSRDAEPGCRGKTGSSGKELTSTDRERGHVLLTL